MLRINSKCDFIIEKGEGTWILAFPNDALVWLAYVGSRAPTTSMIKRN